MHRMLFLNLTRWKSRKKTVFKYSLIQTFFKLVIPGKQGKLTIIVLILITTSLCVKFIIHEISLFINQNIDFIFCPKLQEKLRIAVLVSKAAFQFIQGD